jgi:hypothetical protein
MYCRVYHYVHNIRKLCFCQQCVICRNLEKTAIMSVYNIKQLLSINEMYCVCYMVRTEYLNIISDIISFRRVCKLRKVTIGFVMSVCLSERPSAGMEQLSPKGKNIYKILCLRILNFC